MSANGGASTFPHVPLTPQPSTSSFAFAASWYANDDGAANATSLALIDAPFEVRAAVGGGGLAVIVALVCFGCWLVQRFCEGAKQLSAAAGEEVATAEIAPAHV